MEIYPSMLLSTLLNHEEPNCTASEVEEYVGESGYVEYLARRSSIVVTRDLLAKHFPGVPILKLVEDILRHQMRDPTRFTAEELNFMKACAKDGLSVEEVTSQMVLHDAEMVGTKYTQLRTASTRRTKFKNSVEQLIYEAQWTVLESRGLRRRRANLDDNLKELEEEAQTIRAKKPRVLTPEEEQLREQRRHAHRQRVLERQEQKRREAEQRRLRLLNSPRVSRPARQRNLLDLILEDAAYFQSVTGDGKLVKLGDKRHRRPTTHFVPEFKDRSQIKRVHKYLAKKEETPDLKAIEEAMDREDDEVLPYDPTDIMHDTQVPLSGRKLYGDDIYAGYVTPIEFFGSDMMSLDANVPLTDVLAADIIVSNAKRYRSLPSTFPPFKNGDAVNPDNILRVRFLLHPNHTETYILAEPKSNELDPVFEIQKLFQIHYCLYFSHSERLKAIIYNDYCHGLSNAVASNSFSKFLAIIDAWNVLMVHLSPNCQHVEPLLDVNREVRGYARRPVKPLNHLAVFVEEIMNKDESVSPLPKLPLPSVPTPPADDDEKTAIKMEPTQLLPSHFTAKFFNNLVHTTHMSRFCYQQLLLRAYSRIVSPDSRKLRSYKAFTAEVYGELLPSFISEVLTKVNLQPHQKFYDLGSGVGNTTIQAALEFGVKFSGGCELMEHASHLTERQTNYLKKQTRLFGLRELPLEWALSQSFVDNDVVRKQVIDCDVLIVNNYLFDFPLNVEVGKLLHGLRPGSKIISLRNFIPPRYKVGVEKTLFDYLTVEKHEMSDFLSVSWTANKVPYYISTVQESVRPEYM